MIIAFEGIDGTFKQTNANMLSEYIKKRYKTDKVIVASFPDYNSQSSFLLRSYFSKIKSHKELSPEMISNLFFLDFYYSWWTKLHELNSNNYIIIADRWWYSNIYYQGTRKILQSNETVKYSLPLFDEYAENCIDVATKEFGLPHADYVIKMEHNLIKPGKSYEDRESDGYDINEDDIKYMMSVDEVFRYFDFDRICKGSATIRLDESFTNSKDKYDIFTDIFNYLEEALDEFVRENKISCIK